jgi:hypothetical protein
MDSQMFLQTVGLPSNARWFDRTSPAVMCFDGVALMRELSVSDVSHLVWNAISSLHTLRVLGVFGIVYITVSRNGYLWMINGKKGWGSTGVGEPTLNDPSWWSHIFVNQSAEQFGQCLLAYRDVCLMLERNGFDVRSPSFVDAAASFRTQVQLADALALKDDDNYWAKVLEEVSTW